MKHKIIRTSTVAIGLNLLLKGQLKSLNEEFEVVAVSGGGTDLQIVNEREGIRVVSVSMERRIAPLKDFISLIKLYRVFLKERPLIVHSITPKAGLLSMVAARMAGVPIRMHTFTGLIFPSRKGVFKKILMVMDRVLCMAATHVYPEGRGVKEDLLKYRITRKPLNIIANGNINGIDFDFFDPKSIDQETKLKFREKVGIGMNEKVFLFIGRMLADKGINELVNAFLSLQEGQEGKLKLILVGPLEHHLDPLDNDVMRHMEKNENILVLGFQDDVKSYFGIADIFVLPSYREGFPNVVLQALAMNLPCIVTDVNGCNEVVQNNFNGMVVPARDTEALRKAMENLILDNCLYNELKQQARNSVVHKFRQEYVWNCIKAEYNLRIDEL